MQKIILILVIFFLTTSLNAIEQLKSMKQLQDQEISFLVFEKNGCPWCTRYKSELDYFVAGLKGQVRFFKAQKATNISKGIRTEFKTDRIIVYPMTYVIKKDKHGKLKIIHEIYGYQTSEYLEELFQDLLKQK